MRAQVCERVCLSVWVCVCVIVCLGVSVVGIKTKTCLGTKNFIKPSQWGEKMTHKMAEKKLKKGNVVNAWERESGSGRGRGEEKGKARRILSEKLSIGGNVTHTSHTHTHTHTQAHAEGYNKLANKQTNNNDSKCGNKGLAKLADDDAAANDCDCDCDASREWRALAEEEKKK